MSSKSPSGNLALGELVRSVRERKGITRTELSVRAGVARPTVWRLETGRSVQSYSLEMILAALGCKIVIEEQ